MFFILFILNTDIYSIINDTKKYVQYPIWVAEKTIKLYTKL